MKKILGIALVMASISTAAFAGDRGWGDGFGFGPPGRGSFPAPEIDPASALSAMTMLGTGLVILRGRRSKK
jgi:uncharacterized protein YdeI (BOF family)